MIVLVAIVINSANSYDKLEQLNDSATEVFFAIENQEARQDAAAVETERATAGETAQAPGELQAENDAAWGYAVRPEDDGGAETDNAASDSADADQTEDSGEAAGETDEDGADVDTADIDEGDAGGAASDSVDTGSTDTDGGNADSADGVASGSADIGSTDIDSEDADTAASDSADTDSKDTDGGNADSAASDGTDAQDGVEALSRNITRYYEIEKGDTLYAICREIYGDTAYVQKICELNRISDPDHIHYGQKIILP